MIGKTLCWSRYNAPIIVRSMQPDLEDVLSTLLRIFLIDILSTLLRS